MKITKQTQGNTTTYFYDGVKKYKHHKDSNGLEWWSEYDDAGNDIHFKDSSGLEWWSDNHPDNPKNEELTEEDVRPFEFDYQPKSK
jgi:hypothetical protein